MLVTRAPTALVLLFGALVTQTTVAETKRYDIGPWQLGMTRDQVKAETEFGPYVPVTVTGGLETVKSPLKRGKTHVSFVFHDDQLDYIQVWYYIGPSARKAKKALLELSDEFIALSGGVSAPFANEGDSLTHEQWKEVLERTIGTAPDVAKHLAKEGQPVPTTFLFDMVPAKQPDNGKLTVQFGYLTPADTYFVFLFQDHPMNPDRVIESNFIF